MASPRRYLGGTGWCCSEVETRSYQRPPNVPAFSCERQREAECRPAALVSCNALLGGRSKGLQYKPSEFSEWYVRTRPQHPVCSFGGEQAPGCRCPNRSDAVAELGNSTWLKECFQVGR